MIHFEDIAPGETIPCGSFSLSRDEIIEFARRFDPQPFHLDEEAGRRSHFGCLVASGLHTQAAAIGLMVRRLADLDVVAGRSLNTARFYRATLPDQTYAVSVEWTGLQPTRNPSRGAATIVGRVHDAEGTLVADFGVTYIIRCRPAEVT